MLCETQGEPWFKATGLWKDAEGYTPRVGDIIFLDWEEDGASNHVGIVEKVEDNKVHLIQGNSDDEDCNRRDFDLTDGRILGYGRPLY